jgi:hypothetical protein
METGEADLAVVEHQHDDRQVLALRRLQLGHRQQEAAVAGEGDPGTIRAASPILGSPILPCLSFRQGQVIGYVGTASRDYEAVRLPSFHQGLRPGSLKAAIWRWNTAGPMANTTACPSLRRIWCTARSLHGVPRSAQRRSCSSSPAPARWPQHQGGPEILCSISE